MDLPSLNSSVRENSSASAEAEFRSQTHMVSNGSIVSDQKQDMSSADIKSTPIRSSQLTAREKLRADQVLSRRTDLNSKPQLGSLVLEVPRESDRGKGDLAFQKHQQTCLMIANSGCQKKVSLFELPGGADVFLIIYFGCFNQHTVESWCHSLQ